MGHLKTSVQKIELYSKKAHHAQLIDGRREKEKKIINAIVGVRKPLNPIEIALPHPHH